MAMMAEGKPWCRLLMAVSLLMVAVEAEASVPRDSIVVNGAAVMYVADVVVDTAQSRSFFSTSDWWLGFGVSGQWSNANNPSALSLHALPHASPSLTMEKHWSLSSRRGRVGLRLRYTQPWQLDDASIPQNVKGWIRPSDPQGVSSPVLAVQLIEDNLANERDTNVAPVTKGNALSLAALWEAPSHGRIKPVMAVELDVVRPKPWMLLAPPDPALWEGMDAEATMKLRGLWVGRARIHAGATVDLGRRASFRSATQLRILGNWAPKGSLGGQVVLLVSPTRR